MWTKSRLVRDNLEIALNKPLRAAAPSCYDLARDLAGSVKGLPEDLAENPRVRAGLWPVTKGPCLYSSTGPLVSFLASRIEASCVDRRTMGAASPAPDV